MLYICIPSYNEAPTVGVLLWRIRKVFQEFSREYEVLVYDDGSTDATAETLAPYRDVMPLTVIGGPERRGYSAALDALARAAVKRTRYPRRDAAIFLQGDFTDQPEHIPELVKRFEGGADVVVVERPTAVTEAGAATALPVPVRRLGRVAPWVLKPFVSVPGVRDPFGSYRLVRIAVLRDVVRAAADRAIVVGDAAAPSWAANVELLLNAAAFARRVEGVELAPRYDVRPRETRIRPLADAFGLFRFARAARGRRLKPGAASATGGAARDPAATASAAVQSEPADAAPQRAAAAAEVSTPERASGRNATKTRRARTESAPGASDARGGAGRGRASQAAAPAEAETPSAERRRSRRSRGARRADRPDASAEDEIRPDAGDLSGAGSPADVPGVDGPTTRDDAAVAAALPTSSPDADAEAEARRQRQRERRKRSRQRRAARDAARGAASEDGALNDSTANEGAPASSNDTGATSPIPLAEGRRTLARESAPPPAEQEPRAESRAESRRDAEPDPLPPAATPVAQ